MIPHIRGMNPSVYTKPKKAGLIPVKKRRVSTDPDSLTAVTHQPVEVSWHLECHVTPMDVAHRMVDYLGAPSDGMILEPSAGTGNLVNALIQGGHSVEQITAVELSSLMAKELQALSIKVHHQCFLEYSKDHAEQFPYIIMNPPFKHVRKHMQAAIDCLAPGGVLVALVPITYQHPWAMEEEQLPNTTFPSAKVNTKIITMEKPND